MRLLSTAVQSASSVIEGIRAVDSPIETRVAAWPWGAYLGAEALDELFFTGTASEITPIRSVDRIPVGTSRGGPGGVGPMTRALQEDFLAVVTGQVPDRHGWLTTVDPE